MNIDLILKNDEILRNLFLLPITMDSFKTSYLNHISSDESEISVFLSNAFQNYVNNNFLSFN